MKISEDDEISETSRCESQKSPRISPNLRLQTQKPSPKNLKSKGIISRNTDINIFKSVDHLNPPKPKPLFKLNIEDTSKSPKKSLALMSPKAAEESALLRQKIDEIHKKNKKRLKVKKSKLQRKNRSKLKEFQAQLEKIDKDPKNSMTRRINPGNFLHDKIKESKFRTRVNFLKILELE